MDRKASVSVRLHRYKGGVRPIGLVWKSGARTGEVSSGTRDSVKAERAAGRLEEQLLAGFVPSTGEGILITWEDFCERYEKEWLAGLSYGSQQGWKVASKKFKAICAPKYLADVSKSMLSKFRAELERVATPNSARSYYRALRAGLGWAESVDLIDHVPQIRHRKVSRQSATMRNRTITESEFQRMLNCVRKVRPADTVAFKRFMQALWYSGLRIDELNRLKWEKNAPLHVDLDGDLPLIVILGAQKNGRDSFLPAPKEFWGLIDRPDIKRKGRVFPVVNEKTGEQMTTRHIGRQISECGRLAGVVVNAVTEKCATAHDLRAAYLTKHAAKLSQSQLIALARHSDPKTTSQFYVRHEAEELARAAGWK